MQQRPELWRTLSPYIGTLACCLHHFRGTMLPYLSSQLAALLLRTICLVEILLQLWTVLCFLSHLGDLAIKIPSLRYARAAHQQLVVVEQYIFSLGSNKLFKITKKCGVFFLH